MLATVGQHCDQTHRRRAISFASFEPFLYDGAMRWLLHGTLTPAVGEALRRHGHETKTTEELGLGADAASAEVLRAAHQNQLDLITPDAATAGGLFEEPFSFDRSIVFLHVAAGDVEQDDAVDRLFARYKRLTPGRLYTVTESRVKIRQLPQKW